MDPQGRRISPLRLASYEVGLRLGQFIRIHEIGLGDDDIPTRVALQELQGALSAAFLKVSAVADLRHTALARTVTARASERSLGPLTYSLHGKTFAESMAREFDRFIAHLSDSAGDAAPGVRDWFQLGLEIVRVDEGGGGAPCWHDPATLGRLLLRVGRNLDEIFVEEAGPDDGPVSGPATDLIGCWWSVEIGLGKLKADLATILASPPDPESDVAAEPATLATILASPPDPEGGVAAEVVAPAGVPVSTEGTEVEKSGTLGIGVNPRAIAP